MIVSRDAIDEAADLVLRRSCALTDSLLIHPNPAKITHGEVPALA
ncbi:MAG: hypothetical protein ACFCUH_03605 [Flavobacteriales bacterium]